MTKHLKLPLKLEVIRNAGQSASKVHVERTALSDWCLGLCLLKEGLTESLLVSEERGRMKLELQMFELSDFTRRAQATFGTERIHLRITLRDLDYLLHFFLKYYRDGIAEVDHLDLQAVSRNLDEDESYITFLVAEFMQPVSEDEAKRRLA